MSDELSRADKKLVFADFLISKPDAQEYAQAALKHVIDASNLAVKYLTDLDDTERSSPRLVQQTLNKFEENEAKEFAKFYMQVLKKASKASISAAEVYSDVVKVRKFVNWIKDWKI